VYPGTSGGSDNYDEVDVETSVYSDYSDKTYTFTISAFLEDYQAFGDDYKGTIDYTLTTVHPCRRATYDDHKGD